MLDALAFASEGLYSDKVSVTVVTNMATVAVLSGRAEQIYRAAKKHTSIVRTQSPAVERPPTATLCMPGCPPRHVCVAEIGVCYLLTYRLSVKYGIRTSDASDGLADG